MQFVNLFYVVQQNVQGNAFQWDVRFICPEPFVTVAEWTGWGQAEDLMQFDACRWDGDL